MKIGVFGSAVGNHTEEELKKAFDIGCEIARRKCVLITGATFGIPNSAVKGCHSQGGLSVGISPAYSKESHLAKYKMPLDDDVVVYTGLGYEGRNLINIRTCDAAIFMKGSIGTLNELTIAIKEEKVIGILEDSGGICSQMKTILENIDMNFHPKLVYSRDHIKLVEEVIEIAKD